MFTKVSETDGSIDHFIYYSSYSEKCWIPYLGFDAGYGAYVGFHIVRKTHTHPVMLSFIALLLELKNKNVKKESKKSDAFIRARVRCIFYAWLLKCTFKPKP